MNRVLVKADMEPRRQKVYYPIARGKHKGLGPHTLQRVANQIVYPAMSEAGYTNRADPAYDTQLNTIRQMVMAQMLANPEMHDLEFVNDPMDLNQALQEQLKGRTLEQVLGTIQPPGEDHASFMTPKQQRAAERENAMRSGKMSVSNLTDRTAGLSEKFKQMRDTQQARNAEKYGFPEPEGGGDAPAPDEKPKKAPDMSAGARGKIPGVPDEMQGAFDSAGNLMDAGGPAEPEPDAMAQARAMLANMTPEQIQQLMSMGLARQRQTAVPTMRDPGEGGSDEMLGKAARQFRAHRAAFGDAWSLMKEIPYDPAYQQQQQEMKRQMLQTPEEQQHRKKDPYERALSQNNPYGQPIQPQKQAMEETPEERQRRMTSQAYY